MVNVEIPVVNVSLKQILHSLESAAVLGDGVLDGVFDVAFVETPQGVDITSFGRHLFPGGLLVNPDYSHLLPVNKARLSHLAMGQMYLESGLVGICSENLGTSPEVNFPYYLLVST